MSFLTLVSNNGDSVHPMQNDVESQIRSLLGIPPKTTIFEARVFESWFDFSIQCKVYARTWRVQLPLNNSAARYGLHVKGDVVLQTYSQASNLLV